MADPVAATPPTPPASDGSAQAALDAAKAGAAADGGAAEAVEAPPAAAATVTDEEFWVEHKAWIDSVNADKLEVKVTDPESRGGWGRSYTVYRVVTSPKGLIVWRRFSDFVWLRSCLSDRYVGVLVPPLPEKKKLGNTNDSFIQTRMRQLAIFVNHLLSNPYMRKDSNLAEFLSVQDQKAWDAIKKHPEGTKTNVGLQRWQAALSRYSLPEHADRFVLDMKSQLAMLEKAFAKVVDGSKRLAAKAQAFCDELGAFQATFKAVKDAEAVSADTSRVEYANKSGADMTKVLDSTSLALNAWGRILGLQPRMLDAIVVDSMKFELNQIVSLRQMLALRDQMVAGALKGKNAVRTKTQALEAARLKYQQGPRVDKAQSSLTEAEERSKRLDYLEECITKGLFFSELDRFGDEKVNTFRRMFGQYAAAGGAYGGRLAKMWQTLLTELGVDPKEMAQAAKAAMDAGPAPDTSTTTDTSGGGAGGGAGAST